MMIIANKDDLTTAMYLLMDKAEKALTAGNKLVFELKDVQQTRRTEQNAWYWVFCTAVAKFLDDAGVRNGKFDLPFIAEDIHRINKMVLGLTTTTNLSKQAFAEMCSRLEMFWSDQTNGQFVMPEPPLDYLKMKGYEEL